MTLRQRRPRQRDEKHLELVRSLPCCICGDDTTVEAAHIWMGNRAYGKEPAGRAMKSDDKWAVPLCGRHHREQHTMSEIEFWEEYEKDPFMIAIEIYGTVEKRT